MTLFGLFPSNRAQGLLKMIIGPILSAESIISSQHDLSRLLPKNLLLEPTLLVPRTRNLQVDLNCTDSLFNSLSSLSINSHCSQCSFFYSLPSEHTVPDAMLLVTTLRTLLA